VNAPAVDGLDQSAGMVLAAGALLVVAFVAREVAAGALRAAAQDLWQWLKCATRR
jgi:hypothetical protein